MSLATLYRNIISPSTRKFIYDTFLGAMLRTYRRNKFKPYRLYYTLVPPKTEKQKAQFNLSRQGISPYPYDWKDEYPKEKNEFFYDEECGLRYVVHNGKRLYFKKNLSDPIDVVYNALLIEQDYRSAHKYIKKIDEIKDRILLDVGSAEGIFSLDVIDEVSHVYLFECDEEWIEALQKTFAPWKEKITIVKKYVNHFDDDNNTTLDSFFEKNMPNHLFLKMDIEGFEMNALRGAKKLLTQCEDISGAVCIYHKKNDEKEIDQELKSHGLQTEIQPGFLYFDNDLRHAIIKFRR